MLKALPGRKLEITYVGKMVHHHFIVVGFERVVPADGDSWWSVGERV